MAATPEFRKMVADSIFVDHPDLFRGISGMLTEDELRGGAPLGVPELAVGSILCMLNFWIYNTATPLSEPVPMWKALVDNHGPVSNDTLALLLTMNQAGPVHLLIFSHRQFGVGRPGAWSCNCMHIRFAYPNVL